MDKKEKADQKINERLDSITNSALDSGESAQDMYDRLVSDSALKEAFEEVGIPLDTDQAAQIRALAQGVSPPPGQGGWIGKDDSASALLEFDGGESQDLLESRVQQLEDRIGLLMDMLTKLAKAIAKNRRGFDADV